MTVTPTKQTDGALAGFHTLPINCNKMVAWTKACQAVPIKYGLGSKVKSLNDQPTDVETIDCSGYFRWLMYHATGNGVVIPDGSVAQNAWCASQGFKHYGKEGYANCGNLDGHVRVCFITPESSGEGIGHVFVCYMGLTLESHGHNSHGDGVDMRSWNTPVLANEVHDIYVLA